MSPASTDPGRLKESEKKGWPPVLLHPEEVLPDHCCSAAYPKVNESPSCITSGFLIYNLAVRLRGREGACV